MRQPFCGFKWPLPFVYRLVALCVCVGVGTAIMISRPAIVGAAPNVLLAASFRPGQLDVSIESNQDLEIADPQLTLEVLAPDDDVLATRTIPYPAKAVNRGKLQVTLELPSGLYREDIVWHRLRYRITSTSQPKLEALERVTLISEVMRYPIVRWVGPDTYCVGSRATMQIFVFEGRTQNPIQAGDARLNLIQQDKKYELGTVVINESGSVNGQVAFPATVSGMAVLEARIETEFGTTTASHTIRLVPGEKTLLTTDKPIYQPGQTIHVRALSLDRFTRQACGKRPLTFEFFDGNSNRIARRYAETDAFGVASTTLQLATELNLGFFRIRARLSDVKSQEPLEDDSITVEVKQYQLPKFSVAIELDKNEAGNPRSWYSPDGTIGGAVTARYYFGKPVANAKLTVSVVRSLYDTPTEKPTLELTTDREGKARFQFPITKPLAKGSDEPGGTYVWVNASVTDTALHTERNAEAVRIATEPILILAAPESGFLVSGVENRVYVLTAYPDGTPAEVEVQAEGLQPTTFKTDKHGFGVGTLPAWNVPSKLFIKARDAAGLTGKTEVTLPRDRSNLNSHLLRTDRSLYHTGDTLTCTVHSASSQKTVFLDIIKETQPIFSQPVPLSEGSGTLSVPLTKDMFGLLDVRVYSLRDEASVSGDHQLIYVEPADGLVISAKTERETLKPREEAAIDFLVTDRQGVGQQAILGVDIVDEAVFSLSEKKPGYERAFFYLREQLLGNVFDSYGIRMNERSLVEQLKTDLKNQREVAARLLFAAAREVDPYLFRNSYGQETIKTLLRARRPQFERKYFLTFQIQTDRLRFKINRYFKENNITQGDIKDLVRQMTKSAYLSQDDIRDPFGNEYRIDSYNYNQRSQMSVTFYSSFVSDMFYDYGGMSFRRVFYLQSGSLDVVTDSVFSGKIKILKEENLPSSQAILRGSVTDEDGASLRDAIVLLQPVSAKAPWGEVRQIFADFKGFVDSEEIPAGEYRLGALADGYLAAVTLLKVTGREIIRLDMVLKKDTTPNRLPLQLLTSPRENFPSPYGYYIDAQGKVRQRPAAVLGGSIGVPGGVPGGVVGGSLGSTGDAAPPPPPPPPPGDTPPPPPEGVRSYFPETLYSNPAVITDAQGHARITVKMADSITTWRMLLLGSTADGKLGSTVANLRVFQDFFIDADVPPTLTKGDTVAIPVAVYNYLPREQTVELTVTQADWMTVAQPVRTLKVAANSVSAVYFRIRAEKTGAQPFIVSAHLPSKKLSPQSSVLSPEKSPQSSVASPSVADAVSRTITVIPNGTAKSFVINQVLEKETSAQVTIPVEALSDTGRVALNVYPSVFSQLVEGTEQLIQLPYGCFEQSSSITAVNVAVLNYLNVTGKSAPVVRARSEQALSQGYQKFLSYEVGQAGYALYGSGRANLMLSAYALHLLADMSRVYPVEPAVLDRTQKWVARQQMTDGSFSEPPYFYSYSYAGGTDRLRTTAYVGWALAASGYKGPEVGNAWRFVSARFQEKTDSYTLALMALFALESKTSQGETDEILKALAAQAIPLVSTTYWESKERTPTYSTSETAILETTALVAQALARWGKNNELTSRALGYLLEKRSHYGYWYSTQATVLCLKALTTAINAAETANGTIRVRVNGQEATEIKINAETLDLLQRVDLTKWVKPSGVNTFELRYEGTGGKFPCQLVTSYYIPWKKTETVRETGPPLAVQVDYDKPQLRQDEMLTARCSIKNQQSESAQLVLLELNLPAGFAVEREDFAALRQNESTKNKINKFTIQADTVTLYVSGLEPGETITFPYRLRAKYPVEITTFPSRVYEYYSPSRGGYSQPVKLTITE
ncbi:MAG: hypothetical protein K1Y36_19355 [Blastocatellia bacterium]|nr:hypothetical protein [Blastocatellia bacterium]